MFLARSVLVLCTDPVPIIHQVLLHVSGKSNRSAESHGPKPQKISDEPREWYLLYLGLWLVLSLVDEPGWLLSSFADLVWSTADGKLREFHCIIICPEVQPGAGNSSALRLPARTWIVDEVN